ncbi:MAG TPA: NAD(P)H-dependent oxidoreductase subunit E [Nocardioides sp.]|uniref:NAD(P)H-dependent oxidoreductase subunit E n=1 Tax=Nocardioides sp. TaxID=35761 RepID=UPI002C0D665E|nr:NAD(P)H-dependent oxidoreductase subunit E [Nocardioides sp.]HQR26888.1 NAD(P)H-dependent oxidoreductase subunit E [Nocardioides sp.]
MSDTAHDRAALVRTLAEQHRHERGPLLPALHEVMEELGHLDRSDFPVLADVLHLSVAEVHGAVSFYHDFRTAPPPSHEIRLCRAEACQAVGGQELYDGTRSRAAAGELGEGTEVAEVFCLGNCALGPSGTLDGTLHGRLDGARIDALTREWRR